MFSPISFKPHLLQRILNSASRKTSIEPNKFFLKTTSQQGATQLAYENLNISNRHNLLFYKKIVLNTRTGGDFDFGWVSAADAREIKNTITTRRKEIEQFHQRNLENAQAIDACNKWYASAVNGERWVTYREVDEFLTKYESPLHYLWTIDTSELARGHATLITHIQNMRRVSDNRLHFRRLCNETFELNELIQYKSFFDKILNRPLTDHQRQSIIVDEHAQLVVAAAGSGKTTTIKGKVGYLVQRGLAHPSEILIIAFNKNVQKDLSEALAEAYPGIGIQTFHAFGLKTLGETRGIKPSLSELTESPDKLSKYMDSVIHKLYGENPSLLNEFFISYNKAFRDQFDFEDLGQYYSYVRTINKITLNNESVKSFEELELANFFYVNGINYQYEPSYEHNVASKEYRQYKPDFYLPDYGIYIEHFAMDAQGQTPSFINEAEYLASREWKLQIHEHYKTTLIETFSHQKRAGTLTSILRQKLIDSGVVFAALPPEQLLEKLNSSGYITELGNLLGSFLSLFKGSLLSLEELTDRIDPQNIDAKRSQHFLEIFGRVYKEYEFYLKSQTLIDFNDMIGQAAQALRTPGRTTPFKYLLIDEFQDISIGRAEFVKALLSTNKEMKLMAVGDDWQSIYRFSGSDISVMTNFEAHFGRHEQRLLPETFRFDQMVEKVASRFVLQNKSQLEKVIKARAGSGKKSVILWHPKEKGAPILESIAKLIPKAPDGKVQDVLILARYKFYNNEIDYSKLKQQRPDLNWSFSTVHAAKGAEADYAIILGVKNRGSAFPSEIADDPLLSLVLAKQELYPNAEERRLFYVALTRAKNNVFIVGDPAAESVFFNELSNDPDVDTTYLGKIIARRCAVCKSIMNKKIGSFGLYFQCNNHPFCSYTVSSCKECNLGFLQKKSMNYECDNDSCKAENLSCPRCKEGIQIKRNGPNGAFWGCTNYKKNKCEFSRNL